MEARDSALHCSRPTFLGCSEGYKKVGDVRHLPGPIFFFSAATVSKKMIFFQSRTLFLVVLRAQEGLGVAEEQKIRSAARTAELASRNQRINVFHYEVTRQ